VTTQETFDCRDIYAGTPLDIARADRDAIVVVNDSVGSSKLDKLKRELPDQLVNLGIAEADMVGVAAALENGGEIPFVTGAGCFLSARDGADQGRPRVQQAARHPVRPEPRCRLWRPRSDAPFHRGRCLDADPARHDSPGASRPDRD
jgi:transketolase C-terminal domain/subunit